ncbi:MAG: thioesterase domain-containing protein, partial [Ilumatobacteraceae bacterium]
AVVGMRPRAVELRDLYFLSPFVVGPGEVRTLKVKYDRNASTVLVFSDVEASPHVTATVAPVDVEPDAAPRVDVAAVRARCPRVERFDGYSDQPFMEFGPRWGCLRSVEYGDGEALVTTVVPDEFVPELASMWLHPAVLDVATGSAQALIPGFAPTEMFYVPFSYGRVLARGPVPANAVSHVRLRAASAHDLAVFDITIVDGSGRAVIDLEGFTMRRVAVSAALTARRSVEQATEPAGVQSPIEAAMHQGILAPEGVDALDRILDAGLRAQVVASSVDVDHWIAKVDAEAKAAGDDVEDPGESGGPQYERPNISSAFAVPATPIERELATMWRELLGVERVGRDDDFFELGGQSLIAVRLFTRMKKRYAVDLPLATLFEAPTIAKCAAVVAGKLGVDDTDIPTDADIGLEADGDAGGTGDRTAQAVVPAVAVRPMSAGADEFRSLVTIQRGGDLTPFFCVHGSGGNVLNFRDLSLAMGRSQPFYGLQARGIDGRHAPHDSIEAMATAYLEEIRRIQPTGPYMVGGYSGGGLVAFEMAHQLTDAGEEVALVMLLDTFPPVIPARKVSVAMRLQRLRKDGLLYLKNIYGRRIIERKIKRDLASGADYLARGEVVPTELRERYVEWNFMRAASAYTLRRWRGRVVLFRAEELHFAFRGLGEAYGWDEVVDGGFELLRVPGNHDNLVLEPNASVLVRTLRDTIAAAEGDSGDVTAVAQLA